MKDTTAEQAAKPGRKPLPPGQGKEARLAFRVNSGERAVWQAKADAAGKSLAQWVADTCNRAKA